MALLTLLLLSAALLCTGQPQLPPPTGRNLGSATLEELMNVEVTSVCKKEQKLARVPAAVYVITQEDIRRSAATTLPELLRMVPGIQVARIDNNKWAVTARGFNGRFANKLLVLMDGRTVYTPSFSGVYWELQDTLLEDIERIEVIRGPGATVWGANAVNGVINIITRHARDSQGGLVVAGGGQRAFGAIRYGGRVGQGYYRAYAKYFDRDPLVLPNGGPAPDRWRSLRGGFRTDWVLNESDSLMVEGELGRGRTGQLASALVPLQPGHGLEDRGVRLLDSSLVARWSRQLASGGETMTQIYYDGYERNDTIYGERRHTLDATFEHRFRPAAHHELQWGVGQRYTTDRFASTPALRIEPPTRGDNLESAFFQDEVELVESRLTLTVGSKFEHNGYTGWEVQPGAQLLWSPAARSNLWLSICRAARTPSRYERAYFAPIPLGGGLSGVPVIYGDRDFHSEILRSHEAGWRFQPFRHAALDVAWFYNVYHGLETTEPGMPTAGSVPGQFLVPVFRGNLMYGNTSGVEAMARWDALHRWKLRGTYTWFRARFGTDAASRDTTSVDRTPGHSPSHQASFESRLDLPASFSFDARLYYTAALTSLQIGSYARADCRLGWRPRPDLELSLGAENLLDHRQVEFLPEALTLPVQTRRSVSARLAWQF